MSAFIKDCYDRTAKLGKKSNGLMPPIPSQVKNTCKGKNSSIPTIYTNTTPLAAFVSDLWECSHGGPDAFGRR